MMEAAPGEGSEEAEECGIQLVRNLNGMYDEISDEIDAEMEAEEEGDDE